MDRPIPDIIPFFVNGSGEIRHQMRYHPWRMQS
jgi:hypothetical protein